MRIFPVYILTKNRVSSNNLPCKKFTSNIFMVTCHLLLDTSVFNISVMNETKSAI